MRVLVPTLFALLFAVDAHADKGMPLDVTHYLATPQGADDPLLKHVDHENIDGGKWSAIAHSRLEAELKVSVPDQASFDRMRQALDQLTKNPGLALPKGWSIKFVREADYGDTYLDDKQRILAQHLAGMRKRTVNGENLELNTKPPGGVQSGPDGIILTRPERGLALGKNADLKAIARSESKWNPVNSFDGVVKGDRAKLMDPSVRLQTKRGRYVLGYTGGDASWHSLIDLSADHVYDIKDVRPGAKAKAGAVQHIFGLEGDLNHPGAETGLVVADIDWTPPHTAADAHNDAFHEDAAVKALHDVAPRLLSWMRTAHNVHTTPALPKYTQAALNLGLIKTKQLKLNARR